MKLYSLSVNAREICSVEVESPEWLPVRAAVPKNWLVSVGSRALRCCFVPQPVYLGWNDRSHIRPFLN